MMTSTPATLSLEQKVGQMVMFDFPGHDLTPELRSQMERHAWGGAILFARNLAERARMQRLCADLHEVGRSACDGIPLLIGIDQEGGSVSRLTFPDTPISPGNMAIGATGRPEYAREASRLIAADLSTLHVNVNFAPCVDVNNNPSNPIIGVRSFGEDARMVARMGVEAARGTREAGVIPVAKHFPGHGDTSMDSHLALPVVRHGTERLHEVELLPFGALVADGIEMIMTAHIVYPALTGDERLPATLSERILTDLLRRRMGFTGVVITDSMAMDAVARTFGTGRAAVMAVRAGADIVLACGTAVQQEETAAALLEAVRAGEISEARVDASVERILTLKRRLPDPLAIRPPVPDASERMLAIARDSITLVRDQPSRVPLPAAGLRRLLLVGPSHVSRSPHGELNVPFSLGGLLAEHGFDVDERLFSALEAPPFAEGLVEAARDRDAVVLCLHSRHRLDAPQIALTRALVDSGLPIVALAINSPYVVADIPFAPTCLCTYGYTEISMRAVAEVLAGITPALGHLPVTIPAS